MSARDLLYSFRKTSRLIVVGPVYNLKITGAPITWVIWFLGSPISLLPSRCPRRSVLRKICVPLETKTKNTSKYQLDGWTTFPIDRWLSVGSSRVIVRSPVGCKYASGKKKQGSRVFCSLWRLVWTASALDNWQLRYSAPKMEDAIITSAHWRWRVCVVRYDVAPELRQCHVMTFSLLRSTQSLQWANSIKIPIMFTSATCPYNQVKLSYVKSVPP